MLSFKLGSDLICLSLGGEVRKKKKKRNSLGRGLEMSVNIECVREGNDSLSSLH